MADEDQSTTEPGGLVPPYEGHTGSGEDTTDSDAAQERTHKAFDASNAPDPGSAPPVSTEEREGVSSTDTEPDAALGVGQSSAAGAEEQAPDRDDVGHKGPGRPVGTVADDDSSGSTGA